MCMVSKERERERKGERERGGEREGERERGGRERGGERERGGGEREREREKHLNETQSVYLIFQQILMYKEVYWKDTQMQYGT